MNLLNFIEYSEDFKWDYKLHFPVPTLKYIKDRTGNDLMLEFDTQEEAKGAVIAVTRSAKNFLFSGRRDMLAWEYDIAHNKNLLYEVLEYVLEFINFAFLSGSYEDIFRLETKAKESEALRNARANLVGAKKIIPFMIRYREGY